MQQFYRILVKPYNYDHWDIFTESKELFDRISQFADVDEAREHFGDERWDRMADTWISPKYPYVILGETELRQHD